MYLSRQIQVTFRRSLLTPTMPERRLMPWWIEIILARTRNELSHWPVVLYLFVLFLLKLPSDLPYQDWPSAVKYGDYIKFIEKSCPPPHFSFLLLHIISVRSKHGPTSVPLPVWSGRKICVICNEFLCFFLRLFRENDDLKIRMWAHNITEGFESQFIRGLVVWVW